MGQISSLMVSQLEFVFSGCWEWRLVRTALRDEVGGGPSAKPNPQGTRQLPWWPVGKLGGARWGHTCAQSKWYMGPVGRKATWSARAQLGPKGYGPSNPALLAASPPLPRWQNDQKAVVPHSQGQGTVFTLTGAET